MPELVPESCCKDAKCRLCEVAESETDLPEHFLSLFVSFSFPAMLLFWQDDLLLCCCQRCFPISWEEPTSIQKVLLACLKSPFLMQKMVQFSLKITQCVHENGIWLTA